MSIESDSQISNDYTSIVSALTEVARIAAVVVASLYIAGLLIMNIDLSVYGLVSLNLDRPEYILAGGLWAFLVAITSAAIREAGRAIKETAASPLSVRVSRLIAPLALILVAAQQLGGAIGFGHITVMAVVLSFSCVSVYSFAAKDLELLKLKKFAFSELASEEIFYVMWGIGHTFIVLLGSLSLYTWLVFPFFPPRYGGGHRPLVTLYLNKKLPMGDALPKITISSDRQKIGPVVWLLDTGEMIAIAAELPRDGWSLFFLPPEHSEAVLLDKHMIDAVVYNREAGEDSKPVKTVRDREVTVRGTVREVHPIQSTFYKTSVDTALRIARGARSRETVGSLMRE